MKEISFGNKPEVSKKKGGGRVAYQELMKNFNRVRDYMRDFYVYGLKRREEYTQKSARSYDDERRRMESWLGPWMQFRQSAEGKQVFLSLDSRRTKHNPLYQAWKAKSFTDGDLTLHFLLLGILQSEERGWTIRELMAQLDQMLSSFTKPRTFDESTVRKKLKEYEAEGLVEREKRGAVVFYCSGGKPAGLNMDVLDFFSEVAPCGVIGSFLLDQWQEVGDHFLFKHHYITGAMDSEVVYTLLLAMQEKRSVSLHLVSRRRNHKTTLSVVPLRLMKSVQSGRTYLMAYVPVFRRISSYRVDQIVTVEMGKESPLFDSMREKLEGMMPHLWGVSTQGRGKSRLEKVEMTIRYEENEPYIRQRLEREKRCGTVEQVGKGCCKWTAEVYDSSEAIPWIRTFLGRITEIHFSNPVVEAQFRRDLEEMYALYDVEVADDFS